MQTLTYPPELEAYWVEAARTATRGTTLRDVLHRIQPDISRLANQFTTERPPAPAADASPYLRDTRSCAAYSLFFAPQTHVRMAHLLHSLPPFPDTPQPLRVLDLGCGTGAASWALLDHLDNRPVALAARDRSRAALRGLTDLFSSLRRSRWPQATLRTAPEPLEEFADKPGTFDIILMHYVLNELAPDLRRSLLERAARALAPNGRLILCEPLVHNTGDYMRELRTVALNELNLHVLAPCPHEQACPLKEPCHDVRTWQISQALQILNRTLHRDLRHLAFVPLMLTPAPASAPEGEWARVVGSPSHAKGQSVVPACCADGQVRRLQLLHRDFSAGGRKQLRRLERGQCLHPATLNPLGEPGLFRMAPSNPDLP